MLKLDQVDKNYLEEELKERRDTLLTYGTSFGVPSMAAAAGAARTEVRTITRLLDFLDEVEVK